MPKDIHVEPQKFAAELINRLKEVLRDREAEAKLEERLKRVRAVSDAPLLSRSWFLEEGGSCPIGPGDSRKAGGGVGEELGLKIQNYCPGWEGFSWLLSRLARLSSLVAG